MYHASVLRISSFEAEIVNVLSNNDWNASYCRNGETGTSRQIPDWLCWCKLFDKIFKIAPAVPTDKQFDQSITFLSFTGHSKISLELS